MSVRNPDYNHDNVPRLQKVGQRTIWTLPTGQSDTLQVNARFIGLGTSKKFRHNDHPFDVEFAPPKHHCNACRWFETRIFRLVASTEDDGELAGANYLLHHSGVSIVPGEVVHYRHEVMRSGFEVIEAHTIRRNDRTGKPQAPFITRPSARALAQAAGFDPELESAYVQRATA